MTYSIVARDPSTGAFGVATATAGPVVGSLVPHGRAGVGAIATQALTNPYLGLHGLDELAKHGSNADTVLSRLVAEDAGRDRRQAIMIDRAGRTAAWTGKDCNPYAGTLTADGVAVAGNLIADAGVLAAMMSAFGDPGDLADRLLAALRAGHGAGGDRRGTGSAALKVYLSEAYPLVDIRVDWSSSPLDDLARILAETRKPTYADFFGSIPRKGA